MLSGLFVNTKRSISEFSIQSIVIFSLCELIYSVEMMQKIRIAFSYFFFSFKYPWFRHDEYKKQLWMIGFIYIFFMIFFSKKGVMHKLYHAICFGKGLEDFFFLLGTDLV